MPAVTDVASLRRHVDDTTAALPLFGLSRSEALTHAFRIAQTGHTVHAGSATSGASYENLRAVQDLLRWLTFKIATTCPEGGRPRDTTDRHRAMAREAIELFDAIAKVNEFTLIVESGRCRMHCDPDERLVTFTYENDLPSRRLDRRLIRQERERTGTLAARISGSFHEAQALVDEVLPHVRPRWGDRDFTCRPGGAIEAKVREYMAASAEPPLLPADWSLGAYTLGDHRRFWIHLQALAWLRDVGFVACVKRRSERIPWNGGAMLLSDSELLARVEHLGIMPRAVASEILRDLTYNPQDVPWTDIMYQPLVPLDRHTWLTLPLLTSANHFERNLLAIVDRLPWRREYARRLKEGREELMINAIVPVVSGVGLMSRPRVRLEEHGAMLTDIDVLLWQSDGSVALAVSLKWFYGPDSIREVLTHDEWYSKGIDMAKRAIAHLGANPEDVSLRYAVRPPLSATSLILGCIVGHHDVPSDWVRDAAVPIVKLDQFLETLREHGPDLRAVHAGLCSISAIDEPLDGEESVGGGHDDVRLGDLTVRLPFRWASQHV